MKKLKLNALSFQNEQVLTRAQLKKVLGGDGSGGSGGTPKIDACKNKISGQACSWVYNGNTINGHCKYAPFGTDLYCSEVA